MPLKHQTMALTVCCVVLALVVAWLVNREVARDEAAARLHWQWAMNGDLRANDMTPDELREYHRRYDAQNVHTAPVADVP